MGDREITAQRSLNTKVFDADDGRKRVVLSNAPLHYLDRDGAWQDVDLTPRDVGDGWVIDRAAFVLQLQKLSPVFVLDCPEAGFDAARFELLSPRVTIVDATHWEGAGFAITLAVQPDRFTTVITARGPVTLQWQIANHTPVITEEAGLDAAGNRPEVVRSFAAGMMMEQITGRASVLAGGARRRAFVKAVWPADCWSL